MEKVTAVEVLNLIEKLDDEMKQKVLDLLYDEYFAGGGGVRYNPEL